MDARTFDRFVRSMTAAVSRRGVLRGAAAALAGVPAGAGAQDRDKDKDKDKPGRGPSCREAGHPCEGNQVCCAGLVCAQTGPGNALRCAEPAAADCPGGACKPAPATAPPAAGGFAAVARYRVDVACRYDAAVDLTTCDCVGAGDAGAPPVRRIILPPYEICAEVIDTVRGRLRPPEPATTGGEGGQASAGTGGTANADASGGEVTVGDVGGGDVNINIDASGGQATAAASGGSGNVAVAGTDQPADQAAADQAAADQATLTVTLAGNVAPGGPTTYWVETDAGLRPATGPALARVEPEPPAAGAVVVTAAGCPIGEEQEGFDWFGQCTRPAAMGLSLAPAGGGAALQGTTNEQGRVRFPNLAPGAYALTSLTGGWCHAESDGVDAQGQLLVAAGQRVGVWLFACGQSAPPAK